MTHDDRRQAPDPLGLAEAVAAGTLSQAAAEATLRGARGSGTQAAEADVVEMRELLGAIQGVRAHAEAFDRAAATGSAVDAPGARRLADGAPDGDRRSVAPTPVVRRPVRRQAHARGRSPWALPGVLGAAAVLLVAVVLGSNLAQSPVAATPSPSSSALAVASGSPAPSGVASPTPVASPGSPTPVATPAPTPAPTGVKGVPPISSVSLSGAPGIAYWTLTAEDRIAVSDWEPDGSKPAIALTASTWPDPARGNGIWIDRRVVASPDGRFVAFAETATEPPYRQRLRVFTATGKTLWTDPAPVGLPDLAWSADGSMLAIGQQPGMWRIVTFGAGGAAGAPSIGSFDLGGAYALLGFSASGKSLYGYDSTGDAEYWDAPITFTPSTTAKTVCPCVGTRRSIAKFSGRSDPFAVSNGTTPTTEIATEGSNGVQPGIDPKTGRVLDRGGASGVGLWELRDGTTARNLPSSDGTLGLAWGPDGSIVAASFSTRDSLFRLQTVSPADPTTAIDPVFTLDAGFDWEQFDGARDGMALLGLGAPRAHDSLYLGADELVAIDLATAQAAVFVPTAPGLTGVHVAGWIGAGP